MEMKRRNNINRIALMLVLLLMVSSSWAKKKPNFLFIITDDQTNESIHALNNPDITTPHLDKLSSQGVVFTHCFNQGSWSGAVCIASRTMLNTGRSVFRAPNNASYLPYQGKGVKGSEQVALWGETLRKSGYHTYLTGKWHNSDLSVKKSFDRAEAIGHGMYQSRDKNGDHKPAYNRDGSADEVWKAWDKQFTGHWKPTVKDLIYDEDGKPQIGKNYDVHEHTTNLFADKAINYLMTEAKYSDDPFFMYVAFNAPHDPRQAPKRFVDMYPREKMKTPASFMGEHPFDQGDHKIRDEVLAPFPRTKEAVQVHQSEYYAIITHFDEQLGRILDALKATGKADNTYIIFTSDHGLAVGKHGLMGKQSQYDHSVRMPLIIAGPKLEGGRKVDEMVYMQSVYATTCDLAGIKTPNTVEFRSIAQLLKDDKAKGEKYIFGTYKKFQRMIRSERYKLILYPQVKEAQLFDLKNDPEELNNLYGKTEVKNIQQELFTALKQKQQELGDNLKLDMFQ
ncbi:DUF4976 domain-containing protein [Prolixibacteraceae bacterium JC049]|nr:DUF4976 domain-containing protein [Prolixibacteraceae bacterium JC049]